MYLSDEPKREIWKKGLYVCIKYIWKQILIRISYLYNKLEGNHETDEPMYPKYSIKHAFVFYVPYLLQCQLSVQWEVYYFIWERNDPRFMEA